MKISIITVCYNSGATIEKTIKSVANQTYADIEYIIVDGNSKDDTLSIIKKHEHKISKWISEPDKGLYDAMNKGIHFATGDVIGVLNSDDILYDNSVLESIANFHEKNYVEASVSNVVYTNNVGKAVRNYSANKWIPAKLKAGFMPPHAGIYFRKELFEKYGNYSEDYIIAADFELILRFFFKNEIIWKYLNINTTIMSMGGLSSSGFKSYRIISKEIKKAFSTNNVKCSYLKIELRLFNKLLSLMKN